MASIGIFSTHIQKLGHPIKEIRERGLLQLLTKLKCGFTFDDEVARKRELLDQLLEWFNHDKASLQKEALQLLESIIKSESGSQIMRELDQNDFFSRLDSIKDKIDEDAEMYYHNVLDLLQFVSNIRSDTDLRLPILRCNSNSSLNTYEPESARRTESLDSARSKSSEESREQHSDKITSVPQKPSQLPKHILVYLLPWARFNESDMKTFTLMEDTLQVVKSTSRCCRFILHVFIRDFPAEVFLNHPSVVQKLENLLDSVKCGEVLEVLLGITKSIERRLDQLFDPAFKNSSIKFRDSQKGDSHATEMQPATISVRCMFGSCDKALDQLPVPFFCLNCASKVLSNLAQFNPNDANIAFDLLDCLLTLLRKCVSAEMWNVRHESKTYRDIAQGTYALLKSSGDLLEQLKKCNEKSSKNTHSRLNWIRAVRFTSRLLTWRSGVLDSDGGCSPRPGTGVGPLPPSLVDALEAVLTDVALSAAYPRIVGTIINVVEKPPLALDPQFMRKYREMTRLCESIDHATYLLNKPNENDPKIFSIINRSLSAFEMHQSSNFIENVVRLLFVKTSKFDLTDDRWCDVRKICLFLMANDKDWVRQTIYKMAADIVMAVTTSSGNGNYNENHLNLLFDAQILTEICCHGVVSPCKVISVCSKEILLYLLRSKLVLTESSWRRFIASIIPILSLLDCHAKRDDVLGDAILRIMDMKIAECMQIPRLEILRSNTRVLFNKCYSAQMEAAHNLCRLLCMQDDSDAYLPTPDCIRADMLISALRGTEASDFNIDSNPMLSETDQLLGLTQILDAISQDLTYQRNEPLLEGSVNKESKIDPAFRRSILQQLSVMMRQQGLHSVFLENDGLRIVSIYLRLSLTADDYSLYPDCAICCLSILNSLCGRNAHTRHTLARNQIMYFLIIRAILVHPSDTRTTHLGGQLLFIISQADCAVWDGDEVSLPHAVCTRIRAPLKLTSYWEISVNAVRLCYEWVIEEQNWRSFVRMHWTCSLHNGADNVVKWPCVPPVSMDYAPFLAITEEELVKLKVTAILEGSQQALYKIQNSTSHKAAENAIALLISYTSLLEDAIIPKEQFYSLPWMETFSTYLTSLPSSPKDVNLLLVVIRFLEAFLDSVTSDYSDTAKGWLIKTLIDSSDSVFGIVEKTHVYSITGGGDTQFDVKCRATVARLMSRLPANASIGKLTRSLHDLDYGQFNTLVFLNELVRSVRCILCSSCDITRDNLVAITESLIACTQSSPQVNSSYRGYKGEALLLDVFVCIGAIAHRMDEMDQPIEKCELQWNALVRSLVCGSSCVLVGARSAALSVLARLAASKQTLYQIEEGFETEGYQCDRFVMKKLLDEREASLVKEQAAKMITVLAGHKYSSLPELLEENNFLEALISMLTKFCYEFKRARQIETNIALEAMEERDKHAVLFAKKGSQCSTLITSTSFEPQITNGLVAALADLTLTLIESYQSIIDRLPLWTELGLFRLFFRCLYASSSDYEATLSLRASVCALLSRVVTVCTKTHAAIADTRDCIGALVSVMSITSTDKSIDISKNVFLPQGYTLLGALCSSDKGCSVVWKSLKDGHMYGFFRNVIIALSQMKNLENCDLHKSIFYCLSHLLNPKETTPLDHKPSIEDIPTDAILREEDEVRNSDVTLQRNGITKYLSEELCKVIFGRMQDAMTRIQADLLSRDDYWVSAQTALCAALILSPQARTYANELGFAAAMVSAIANVRNTLTVQGASVEMIKNKDKNPSLQTLNLLITLLGSFMRDCAEAKESVAEQNIAVSLNKLWPWIMSTEPLRSNTILMMSCMTNGCHKIWNQMHLSVGASCLISEVCRLISRDLSHASRCKSLAIACLRVLSHCLPHAHCRTLIIKSDVLDCVEKIHPALSKRRSQWKDVDKEIESFLEQVSRYPDGQIKLWQYHATLCALVEQKNGLMIKVLANLAYNHYNRAKILASDEVMNVFSSILQSDGNEVAKVDVCRALWALAANNHKAKLSLRASGLATRVRDLAARSSQHDDKLNQLVHYTYSLLSVT